MIKTIIQCADIHIRNYKRHEEYTEQFNKFMNSCREICSKHEDPQEEVRILICGDLVHQKTDISNELMIFVSNFLRELSSIAPVLVFCGNHDLLVNNTSKVDTLTALFETAQFDNVVYLDGELSYKSGGIVDDNINWCLFSIHDNYSNPGTEDNGNLNIALYHGPITGIQLNNGFTAEHGLDGDVFKSFDAALLGDIHKYQTNKKGDCEYVYSGSLVQQTFGETITQHGFVVWNTEDLSHDFIELDNDYSLYDFEIDDISDIDNDNERLLNF